MPFKSVPSLFKNRERGLFAPAAMPQEAVIAHIDGGARGNPGPAGYGVVLETQQGDVLAELSEFLGHRTNNFAEYSALVAALEWARQNGRRSLKVFSDSELLVKQMRGEYKVKSPDLKPLCQQAQALVRQLEWFAIEHVRREQNPEADRLANEAMDAGMRSAFPRGEVRNLARSRMRAGAEPREFNGVVRNGKVELEDSDLPDGTRVRVRVE